MQVLFTQLQQGASGNLFLSTDLAREERWRGGYVGARAQRYLPDLWIRIVLGSLVILLASSYLGELL